jgi:hypothetical protein
MKVSSCLKKYKYDLIAFLLIFDSIMFKLMRKMVAGPKRTTNYEGN